MGGETLPLEMTVEHDHAFSTLCGPMGGETDDGEMLRLPVFDFQYPLRAYGW